MCRPTKTGIQPFHSHPLKQAWRVWCIYHVSGHSSAQRQVKKVAHMKQNMYKKRLVEARQLCRKKPLSIKSASSICSKGFGSSPMMHSHCFSAREGEKKHPHTHRSMIILLCVTRTSRTSILTCQYPLSVFGRQGLPSLRVADRVKSLKQKGPQPTTQRTNLLPERLVVTQRREREGGEEWKGVRYSTSESAAA